MTQPAETMTMPRAGRTLPDWETLWRVFRPAGEPLPVSTLVAAEQVPQPFRDLLAHDHHMTVTLERHHGSPVDLHVLKSRLDGDRYSRMLTLSSQKTGRTVMFGIMRIDLSCVSAAVRAEILAAGTPLGRILINHNVLRRVEFHRCMRVEGDFRLGGRIDLPTYGRLATIYCDERPAIELLEIVSGRPDGTPPPG